MERTQYRKDLASLLEYYPPAEVGRPSSAKLRAFTSGTATLFSETTLTLDTAQQQLTATATHDADTLTVADSSAFEVGRRYIVRTSGGRKREVVCLDVPSSTTVKLDAPVGFALTTSDFIEGHGLRRTLSAVEAATVRRRVRLEWEYVGTDGFTYIDEEYVDIVRTPFRLRLTEGDIEFESSTFGERAGARGGWRKLVQGAVGDVWRRVSNMGQGVYPDLVKERKGLKVAVARRVLQKLSVEDQDLSTEQSAFKRWGKLYDEALREFEAASPWYDSDDDQAVDYDGTRTVTVDGELVELATDSSETLGDGGELGFNVKRLRVG